MLFLRKTNRAAFLFSPQIQTFYQDVALQEEGGGASASLATSSSSHSRAPPRLLLPLAISW
jgi:hypothetical protein